MKKPTPIPSTHTCLFRIVVVLILIVVLCAAFALTTVIENWQHPASHAIQMVSPSCGTIIQTDGSIVCQNTGFDNSGHGVTRLAARWTHDSPTGVLT